VPRPPSTRRATSSTARARLHPGRAANRTSEIARVLTVLSGVMLPLTLVTGIYGMNFEHMPELKWKWPTRDPGRPSRASAWPCS
jgi:Mg2+ and Co2+ transporter CorA